MRNGGWLRFGSVACESFTDSLVLLADVEEGFEWVEGFLFSFVGSYFKDFSFEVIAWELFQLLDCTLYTCEIDNGGNC